MAMTVDIYKHGIKLGSGSATSGSASITGYSAVGGSVVARRNVQIQITAAGTHKGRTWNTRVLTDNGSGTLTLVDACPFIE